MVNISNDKTISDCHVKIAAHKMDGDYDRVDLTTVSDKFEIHPHESKHIRIIRCFNHPDGIRRELSYHSWGDDRIKRVIIFDDADPRNDAVQMYIQPHLLDIKVFARDHRPANLTTILAYDTFKRSWTIRPVDVSLTA